MKIRSFFLVILIASYAAVANAGTATPAQLYTSKQYFELRDLLRSTQNNGTPESLFFRAVVANKFNQPNRSILYVQRYLNRVKDAKDPSWLVDCYEILADNYLKTYQYRKAAAAYEVILTRLGQKLKANEKADYQNSFLLWNALRATPPQTASFHGDSVLRADIKAVPFEINRQKLSFGFDSGADISIITNSLAHKLGMQIIPASIKVGSITGEKVTAHLGVARELKIGSVSFRNVVFLVFEDEDLLGPSAGTLKGILGFPVISALREITFSRSGEIVIPASPSKQSAENLCLEGLKPLITGVHQGKRLTFTFDTGASRSTLYPPFVKEFEEEIKSNYELLSEKITGVGGSKDVPAYRLKNLVLTFAGLEARFAEIAALTEPTLGDSSYFYGNVGQDLIMQFETMTMNFRSMSIVFK